MNQPFTHEQAEEICEDFEDLIDTELIINTDVSTKCYVDHVTMVPNADADKAQFMAVYEQTKNIANAISQYTGDEYDVYIIATDAANDASIITQDIRTYIANNGVGYNFPD